MPLQFAMLRPWMVTCFRQLTRMSLVFFAVLATMHPCLGQDNGATAPTANSVVATVNADPITEKTLANETLRRYGKEVMDSMVNRFLILQACQQQGIEVSKQEIKAEIERQASKFRLDLSSYLQLLQNERNISANEYSNTIVWPMLALRRLVSDQIEVTEEEFNKAYLARFGEAVKCRMIMMADRTEAESVRQQAIADPSRFEELAKEFSNDQSSASIGGLIPPIRRFTGEPKFEDAVFALQDNQVSELLPLGDQWMILQAVRRLPAASPAPQAIPAIKAQIHDQIRDEKVRIAASNLFKQLQQQAKVTKIYGDETLMKQHPGVAALINEQALPIHQVAEEAVRRHGADVLEGEINRKLLVQALRQEGKQVTSDDLSAETKRAAMNYGFLKPDGTADLEAWVQSVTSDGQTTQDVYIRDAVWPSVALRVLVEDQVNLSQEELQQGFEAAYGPKAEVLAIVLADQRTAQKVWQMARGNPTEAFFGSLAEQYSIEPSSASNSGMVPPIRRFGGQPAIEKEAFSLKPGELSGIVATGDKYIILRCLGFTEPVVQDPSVVQSELTRDLSERKLTKLMGEKFDQLKNSAEVENYFAASLESSSTIE